MAGENSSYENGVKVQTAAPESDRDREARLRRERRMRDVITEEENPSFLGSIDDESDYNDRRAEALELDYREREFLAQSNRLLRASRKRDIIALKARNFDKEEARRKVRIAKNKIAEKNQINLVLAYVNKWRFDIDEMIGKLSSAIDGSDLGHLESIGKQLAQIRAAVYLPFWGEESSDAKAPAAEPPAAETPAAEAPAAETHAAEAPEAKTPAAETSAAEAPTA
ncbi:MAG: hypothetical protein K6E95_01485, partial [Lachnospiraceae bacterium]|nr:hypothetical protein [Lachnospiraceae bacterium]